MLDSPTFRHNSPVCALAVGDKLRHLYVADTGTATSSRSTALDAHCSNERASRASEWLPGVSSGLRGPLGPVEHVGGGEVVARALLAAPERELLVRQVARRTGAPPPLMCLSASSLHLIVELVSCPVPLCAACFDATAGGRQRWQQQHARWTVLCAAETQAGGGLARAHQENRAAGAPRAAQRAHHRVGRLVGQVLDCSRTPLEHD